MQSFRRVRRKRTFLRVMRSYFEASSGAFYPQKRSFAAPCLAKIGTYDVRRKNGAKASPPPFLSFSGVV